MRDPCATDELRRCINVLYVTVDDPIVRSYLDAAFVALEEEPTDNGDLSPVARDPIVDFDSPIAILDELQLDRDHALEPIVRCRHALRSAECLWHLREGQRAG